jgi:hypothetical protein
MDAQGSAANPSLAVISTSSPQEQSTPAIANVRAPVRTQAHTDCHPNCYRLLPDLLPADPALREVVAAWDRLPKAVRAGIVAMVHAAASGK